MRSRATSACGRCAAGVIAVGLAAGGLSGCGAPPHPLDSASPTATPPESPAGPAFASPEAAFEAAVATYQRYVDISNVIAAEGGADPDRILEVVVDNDFAQAEREVFDDLSSNGLRVEGESTFANPQLVQYQDGARMIQIYACGDVSGTRVMDRDGVDVTPERDPIIPYLVTFAITTSDVVLVSDSELWDAPGVC